LSEVSVSTHRPTDKVGRILFDISRWLALFGGGVIGAMAVMTTISIIGRAFFSSPIAGDVELIELGTGTAVFAFLPYTQMTRGNIIVDFFLVGAPRRGKGFFDSIGILMFLIIAALLTWRMIFGGLDMYDGAETTGVLAIPRWWSFPYAFLCFVTLICVIVYTLFHPAPESEESSDESDDSGVFNE
jgi:TRAP-type C4-dicarboxylate transport system permease small subunit